MRVATKQLGLLVGVLALLATSPASADHSNFFTVDVDPNTTNANATITATTNTPANKHAKHIRVHLAPGFKVAHQNSGTSPITPVPQKDEQIGEGSTTARWQALFCAQSTIGGKVYMDELDSGAPSNAVARIRIEPDVSFVDDFFGYVLLVNDSEDKFFPNEEHYDLLIEDLAGGSCSSFSAQTEFTFFGTTASGGRVSQNPATAGDYDICVEYIDRSDNEHCDCTTVEIVDP